MFEGQFNSDNWHRDAKSIAIRDAIRARRWGMRVTVYLGASSGDYVLSYGLASINIQDNNNWLKVADIGDTWGGGGGVNIYNADGTLTGDRTLTGDNYNLTLDGINSYRVFAGDVLYNSGPAGIEFSSGGDININAAGEWGASAGDDVTFQSANGNLTLAATSGDMDFRAAIFRLQTFLATDPTTQFFAGDGAWRYALGQALDSNVTSPTAGEDGYVLAWNDANQEYELVAPSGGGLTFENGVEEISAGVVGLGSPLTQNTLINGATFNLQLGTFVTSPMGTFQSYAGSHFWSSRDPGTGAAAGLTLNTEFQVGLASDGGKMIVQQTTAQTDENAPIVTFDRLGDNTNTPGMLHGDRARSSGTAAAGFGVFNQLDLEVSDGSTWIAMQDETTWEVATLAGEYSQWRKLLAQNHAPTEVYKIETNPDILHTFTGLIMMGDLPAVDPGIPGRLYHTAGAVMVSL